MNGEDSLTSRKIKFVIFAAALSAGSFASAGSELVISTAGLGDARYGMDIASVEHAIGRSLLFPNGKSRVQVQKMQCSYGRIVDLPEVELRFEMGKFTAVDANKPNVVTQFGARIGDPEKSVIERYQRDPTYSRSGNQYDDTFKEITLGKVVMVGKVPTQRASGFLIKFTSKMGRIIHIQAGRADYVMLVEHDDDCGE